MTGHLIIQRCFDNNNIPFYYPMIYFNDPFFCVKTIYKPSFLVYEFIDEVLKNRGDRIPDRGHYGLMSISHTDWTEFKQALKSHYRMKYTLRAKYYWTYTVISFEYDNIESVHPYKFLKSKIIELFQNVKNNADVYFWNEYKTAEERKIENIRWKTEYQIFEICKKYYKDTIHQWRAPFLRSEKGYLACDIYIPSLNLVIEYQGEQHFHEIPFFDREENSFQHRQKLDALKKQLLLENNINLLYFDYTEDITEQFVLSKIYNYNSNKEELK